MENLTRAVKLNKKKLTVGVRLFTGVARLYKEILTITFELYWKNLLVTIGIHIVNLT